MSRANLGGKGQALDGDSTTTGAVCVASSVRYKDHGRAVLRVGDSTTRCPRCGETGTVVDGLPIFVCEGQVVAIDGSLIDCACPSGLNRVEAPL